MAILFDLDGTLLDTSHDIHTAINLTLAEESHPLVEYQVTRNNISFGSKGILAAALDYDLHHNQQHKQYIDKLHPRVLEHYANTKFKKTIAFPGIDELLATLDRNHMVWGVVTNKISNLTEPLLKITGYFERCACIVSGDTTPKLKPAPDPLLHACKILNVEPSTCLFIGDAYTDIQAGKAAGMQTMAVGFGFVPPDVPISKWGADYTVNSATEIYPWIEKWSSTRV